MLNIEFFKCNFFINIKYDEYCFDRQNDMFVIILKDIAITYTMYNILCISIVLKKAKL